MNVRKTLEDIISSSESSADQRQMAAGLLSRLDAVEKDADDNALDPATKEKMDAVAGRPVACRSEFNPLTQVLRLGVIKRGVR